MFTLGNLGQSQSSCVTAPQSSSNLTLLCSFGQFEKLEFLALLDNNNYTCDKYNPIDGVKDYNGTCEVSASQKEI